MSGVYAAGISERFAGSLSATDRAAGTDQSDSSALRQHAGVLQHDAANPTLYHQVTLKLELLGPIRLKHHVVAQYDG